MTVRAQQVKLKAGELLDNEESLKVSKWAELHAINDINKLPTWEIVRRVYIRHQTGLWQSAALATWAVLVYKVIW